MAKVKWIKVWTDMFDDEKIKLIDTLPERDTIHYIWMRLLILAGKTNANGDIFLDKNISYTEEMLSAIFNRPIESVKLALKILKDFNMIAVNKSNVVKISNWETYQNVEGLDRLREGTRKRVAAYRARKKAKKNQANQDNYDDNNEVDISDTKETAEKMDKRIKHKNNYEDIDLDDTSEVLEKTEIKNQSLVNKAGSGIINYYENIFGKIGTFNLDFIEEVIREHGEERVKMAIEKAINVNKISMGYVKGILKNWANEGFLGGRVLSFDGNEDRSNYSEYKGFKPEEPNQITDEEFARIEAEII